MNFKRNLFVITTALVGALALSGCDFGEANFEHFKFINEVSDTHETIEGNGFTKFGEYDNYKVVDKEGIQVDMGNAYELFRDHGLQNHIKSTGEQKILVVPVEFSDYKVEKLSMSNEKFIDNINKAFFGNTKNNAYVSVGEYFNKSSYGKLKLDGKVCDQVFTFPYSVKDIKDKMLDRDYLANECYKAVINWYKGIYNDLDSYKIEGLKDGKNIPIFMVYTYPGETNIQEDPRSFFWAYTFNEVPLAWASSSFMYLEYGLPDSHTYIHETGHLFGLVDYYPNLVPEISRDKIEKEDNGDENEKDENLTPEPTARIDMMDCSIGDETSFSKMFLNWTRPTYVHDSCELSLNSFADTGEVILLSNDWNNTPFDEYYLLEYYTPTRLNTYDISVGNSEARLPKVSGLKIYHVDARLACFDGKDIFGYCNDVVVDPEKAVIGFAHDNNTYSDPDVYQKNYLYSLLLNHENGMKAGAAIDSNLFRFGDEIPELTLNVDGKLDFKISITWATFTSIGLKFEKPVKIKK